MRNVTLSAEPAAIDRAREKARSEGSTLNQAFRDWLVSYAGPTFDRAAYRNLLARVNYARAGRKFNRDEMNER